MVEAGASHGLPWAAAARLVAPATNTRCTGVSSRGRPKDRAVSRRLRLRHARQIVGVSRFVWRQVTRPVVVGHRAANSAGRAGQGVQLKQPGSKPAKPPMRRASGVHDSHGRPRDACRLGSVRARGGLMIDAPLGAACHRVVQQPHIGREQPGRRDRCARQQEVPRGHFKHGARRQDDAQRPHDELQW